MKGSVGRFVALVGTAVLFGLAAPASAQVKGIGLEGGYQFQRISRGEDHDNFRQGIGLAVTVPASAALDVIGLFDFSQKTVSDSTAGSETTTKLQNFAAGVRWNIRRTTAVTPFVQAAAGATRFSGDYVAEDVGLLFETTINGMVQAGGGAIVPISGRLSGYEQANYRRIFTDEGRTNGLTIGAGIHIRLN